MPKMFLIRRRCSICGVDEVFNEPGSCCIDERESITSLPLRFDIPASGIRFIFHYQRSMLIYFHLEYFKGFLITVDSYFSIFYVQ